MLRIKLSKTTVKGHRHAQCHCQILADTYRLLSRCVEATMQTAVYLLPISTAAEC